jgi:hypothetical protein
MKVKVGVKLLSDAGDESEVELVKKNVEAFIVENKKNIEQ